MGNRASYVLIENQATTYYYSHWGALVIPQVILEGPEGTITYIRGLERYDKLLNTIYADGGILLDADKQMLIWFADGDVCCCPELRRVLLPILQTIWPGWTVQYARFSMVDFARHLGLDVQSVLAGDPRGDARYPTLEELRVAHPDYEKHLITVKWPDSTVTDYLLAYQARTVVALGAELLPLPSTAGSSRLPA